MDGFSVDKTLPLKEEQQNLFSVLQSIDSIPGVDINSIKQKFAALYAFNQSQIKDEWLDINLTGWLSDTELFEKIRKAIIEKDKVEFIYTNVRSEEQKRIVEPRKLTFRYRTWYLYGFYHNCLTIFQCDPALAYNILTGRTDHCKTNGFRRTGTALTDTNMKYLLPYPEQTPWTYQQAKD